MANLVTAETGPRILAVKLGGQCTNNFFSDLLLQREYFSIRRPMALGPQMPAARPLD
jgi:hypothetical protein